MYLHILQPLEQYPCQSSTVILFDTSVSAMQNMLNIEQGATCRVRIDSSALHCHSSACEGLGQGEEGELVRDLLTDSTVTDYY